MSDQNDNAVVEEKQIVSAVSAILLQSFVFSVLLPFCVVLIIMVGINVKSVWLVFLGSLLALPAIVLIALPIRLLRSLGGSIVYNPDCLKITKRGQAHVFDWYVIAQLKHRLIGGMLHIETASGKAFEFSGIKSKDFKALQLACRVSKGQADSGDVIPPLSQFGIDYQLICSSLFLGWVWRVVIVNLYVMIWVALLTFTGFTEWAAMAVPILLYALFGSLYFILMYHRYAKQTKASIAIEGQSLRYMTKASEVEMSFEVIEEIKYHWLGNRICIQTQLGEWYWVNGAWPKDYEQLHEQCFVHNAITEQGDA